MARSRILEPINTLKRQLSILWHHRFVKIQKVHLESKCILARGGAWLYVKSRTFLNSKWMRKTLFANLLVPKYVLETKEHCVRDKNKSKRTKSTYSKRTLSFLQLWRRVKNRKPCWQVPEYENEPKRTRNIMLETTQPRCQYYCR